MRQDGSRGCEAAATSTAASTTRERDRERKRERGREGDYFFLRAFFSPQRAIEEGEREILPIEMVEAKKERKKERERRKGGPDRVGLEALAGRLSRRGGSTPPEGDFSARLRELSGNGEVGHRCAGRGIAEVWEGWWRTGWKSQRGPPLESRPRRPPRDCSPEAGIACQAPLTHHPLWPHFVELALTVGPTVGPSVSLPILPLPLLDAAVSSGPVARAVRIRSRMNRRLL